MSYSIQDFTISDDIKEKFNEIIELILLSTTIDNKEKKQYWIDALSTMTDDQVDNLKKILTEEKDELEKIDKQYESQVKQSNEKTWQRFNEEEYKAKKAARELLEKKDQEAEAFDEDALLKELNDI